jgi:hypothetical protein
MRQVTLIMSRLRWLVSDGHNFTGDDIERNLDGRHWARPYAYLHQSVQRDADGVQVSKGARPVSRLRPVLKC